MTATEPLLFSQEGRIALLTLNRPRTRNALDDDLADALVAACERIDRDLSISCVVLAAAGPAFCSGGNVKAMHARTGMFAGSSAEMRRAYRYGIQRVPLAFHALEVPVIAAVNGPAIGAGCDLALMCDVRLASETAVFAESFVQLGLVSGDGGAWLLQRAIGRSRAYEMTLTGDAIDAQRALQWGLVSSVHPAGSLLDEARALAARIAAHPPHSLRLNKRLLRESEHLTLSQSLELAAGLQSIVQHTEDLREGVAALLDKRKPLFHGK